MNNTVLMTVGRVLLGLYFMIPGAAKLVAWEPHLLMMAEHSVPMAGPLLGVAALAEVLAGVFLIAGGVCALHGARLCAIDPFDQCHDA